MGAQPDFIQPDYTVHGFGYGPFDVPSEGAGLSGGVPSSDSAPVVKHDQIGRPGGTQASGQGQAAQAAPAMGALAVQQMPAQPPAMHVQPGYPWQGHPQAGEALPFVGPGHTSPMTRGGPNVGAYAQAPAPPTAIGGAGYPLATAPSTGPVPGQTPFGGYAGVELAGPKAQQRRAARRRRRNRRDVQGEGGYVYRQLANGNIRILVSGEPHILPAGTLLTPQNARWNAITAEIGTWEAFVAHRRAAVGQAVAQGVIGVAEAATGGGPKRRRRRGGAPAPLPAEAEGGLPGWVPYAAAAGLIATVAYLALKSD